MTQILTIEEARDRAKVYYAPSRARLKNISKQRDLSEFSGFITLKDLKALVPKLEDEFGLEAELHFDIEQYYSDSYQNFYLVSYQDENDEDYAKRMSELDKAEEIHAKKLVKNSEANAKAKETKKKKKLEDFNKLKAQLEKEGLI